MLKPQGELIVQIDELRADADIAIRTLYALMRFNEHLKSDRGVNALNGNSIFWRVFHHAIVTNLLIYTRRIFDKSNDAKTVKKLINACKQQLSEFSKEEFEKRKLKGVSERPSWLDSCLKQHQSLTITDFKDLDSLIKKNSRQLMADEEYYVISNKIIAHALELDLVQVNKELAKVDTSIIEASLLSIHFALDKIRVNYTMGHILHNGQILMGYPFKQEVFDSIDQQLFNAC